MKKPKSSLWGATVLSMCASIACSGTPESPPPESPGSVQGVAGAGGGNAVPPEGTAGTLGEGVAGTGGGGLGPTASDDPGLIGLRRLNRTQYNNTVRDLLGTSARPADSFPSDDLVYGYDTVGDALSVSTLLFERFEGVAQTLISELLARPGADPFRSRYITCDVATGVSCATQIFTTFAERAWRRPAQPAEIQRYSTLFDTALTQGQSAQQALQLGLQTILFSPHFMFRVELDPDPNSVTSHPLSDLELASRLSYLLWGSLPDDALLAVAATGGLQNETTLLEQLGRMATDIKVDAFVDDMAGMWLQARSLRNVQPNSQAFPAWNAGLGAQMEQETKLFFREFYDNPLPVNQMLTAPFTFADATLAAHYGIQGVTGTDLQRVDLTGNTERMGLLTQGAFLTITSNPTMTSPVKRGKWVLEQMMCSAPPPPPDGVDTNLLDISLEGLSGRERLEAHKQKGTTCAACHAVMDPIGFGLENYDGIGVYREMDGTTPVDASGELPGTPPQAFVGAQQLAQLLAQDPRLASCVAKQLATYALGALEPARAWAERIAATATQSAGGIPNLRSLMDGLVVSAAFRTRRASGPVQSAPVGGVTP